MKNLLIILLLCPLGLRAQIDSLSPYRNENLKPIESDLIPGYYGRYGSRVRTQYTYDGLDVQRTKDLKPYIMASGSPEAIREFSAYLNNRKTGGWLIAGGITSAIIGTIIMASNGPGSDGKFTMQQPFVCPTGNICGGSLGTVYGGQIAGYQTVTDTQRQNSYAAGGLTLIGGAILAGIGWGLNMPGQHVRRAVQYYNRALKQRGVSWQLKPYSSISNSGVGLVGRF